MTGLIQVQTTFSSKDDAEKLAQDLVSWKLAACVQVIAVRSTYRWKGRVVKELEWLCLMKTKEGLFNEVSKAIRKVNPNDIPEIVAVPIVRGSKDYLRWIEEETLDLG
ncbi:MAG: divalent-cation tolerance protein CutA [Candidatus Thermoplasmatota archaeon]|jgi:periplasmic divalent cation tolerance protein|nr:divalent-cation tolerance protein CutA [Candidatus Thermoplasmatota archaeon]